MVAPVPATPLYQGIVKVGNKVNRGISAIIFADPGVGKTTCAARLPVDETLFINVEAGLGALLGTGHASFQLPRDLKTLAGIYKFLREGNHPFKYVVVDNVSELQEWMVLSLTEMRKKDFAEVKEKGDASSKLREYCYNFRDLIDLGINVVFNAWEMSLDVEQNGDTKKTRLYPKMYPKLAPEICGIVDMVGHLEKYDKTGDRFIRFEGDEKVFAKAAYRGVNKFEPADLNLVFNKIRKFNYEKAKPLTAVTAEEIQLLKGGVSE